MIPLQLAVVNSVVFTVKATDADEDILLYVIDKASVGFHSHHRKRTSRKFLTN